MRAHQWFECGAVAAREHAGNHANRLGELRIAREFLGGPVAQCLAGRHLGLGEAEQDEIFGAAASRLSTFAPSTVRMVSG